MEKIFKREKEKISVLRQGECRTVGKSQHCRIPVWIREKFSFYALAKYERQREHLMFTLSHIGDGREARGWNRQIH